MKSFEFKFNEKLSASLKRLLEDEIVLADDCYYFKREWIWYDERFTNKTGNECFANRLIIEFENRNRSKGMMFYLKQAISFSIQLAHKLETLNENFTLIVMVFDNYSIVFRFHKTRIGEEWLMPDIEKSFEELFVIDVTKSNSIGSL